MAFGKIGKPTCSTNCLLRSCVAPMKGRSLACSSRSVLSLRRGQQLSERSSRGRSRLQGGYRCDHPQGEAGVCAKEKAKKEAKPMPSGGAKNRKAAWITWGAARLPKILHIPAQRPSLRANATHSMRLHEWGLRARAFPSSGRCVRFSINVM